MSSFPDGSALPLITEISLHLLAANISERTAAPAAKNPLRLYPPIMPSLPSRVMIEALEKGGVHYGEASRKEAPD